MGPAADSPPVGSSIVTDLRTRSTTLAVATAAPRINWIRDAAAIPT